jgi:hypothetical protein
MNLFSKVGLIEFSCLHNRKSITENICHSPFTHYGNKRIFSISITAEKDLLKDNQQIKKEGSNLYSLQLIIIFC